MGRRHLQGSVSKLGWQGPSGIALIDGHTRSKSSRDGKNAAKRSNALREEAIPGLHSHERYHRTTEFI